MQELTQSQIDERIAVLRRFRKLLERQRDKFREYLNVLEAQQQKIETDDGEAMLAHARLEEQIVSNISDLQKVIGPIQTIVKENKTPFLGQDGGSFEKLQSELSDLQKKVLVQNEKNRTLLKNHMEQIKQQLLNLQRANPYRGNLSVYAQVQPVATTVAIEV